MHRRTFLGTIAALLGSSGAGSATMTTTIDIRGETGPMTVTPATGGGLEIAGPSLDILRINSTQAADLATGLGVTPAPQPPTLSQKLLVNGDSIAYAVRPGVTQAQSAFQRIADARGLTLVNAAVPGYTTTQMLNGDATTPRASFADLLATHTPGAVAIMMSANDSYNGVSVAQGKQNMIDMIDMAQACGANVTIYMHPVFFHDGGVYLHGVGKDVYAFMQELGGRPGVQFVDVFGYFCRYLFYSGYNGQLASSSNPIMIPLFAPDANGQPDWLHPSAVAQNFIVEPTLMNPKACAVL